MTPQRVELGRYLFYDARLSGNGMQSCATCHVQTLAFTDGRTRAIGSTGQVHPRSSQPLVNVAYRDVLTWANPDLRALEQQVILPLLGTTPVEMGLAGHEERAFSQLRRDRNYGPLFAAGFPGEGEPVNLRNVTLALSAFVRSIVSFRSPYDRFRFEGDRKALSPAALRGMALFFGPEARCGSCHLGHNAPGELGLNLDGGSRAANRQADDAGVSTFHNTGLYNLPGPVSSRADSTGLHEHTGRIEDVGRFRVPSLRNIAVTKPYMHDGSIATLEGVLDHYVAGGRARGAPQQSSLITPLQLDGQQRSDLIAFLNSLTDLEALRDPRWGDPWPDAVAR
jgi:cytochrome c peroxidase